MTKIYMFGNHKGGCAKSTTALEGAEYLSAMGKKVLVLDVDPQANLSSILLAGQPPKGRKLADILVPRDVIRPEDINTRTFPNNTSVDFVCSGIGAGRMEARLIGDTPKEYVISEALVGIKDHYDAIIIDTPPSAEILSLSSMIAADELIVTTCADKLCSEGVDSILTLASKVKNHQTLNPNLKVKGIIVTRYRFTLNTRYHLAFLRKNYGDLLVETPVRECTKAQQAISNSLPVLVYDSTCSAARDYSQVFATLFKD